MSIKLFNQVNSFDFNYEIRRSKRKTVAIHVENDRVEVRAPNRTPKYFIEQFVAEKKQWIDQQLLEQKQKQSEVYAVTNGALIPFMGSEIRLAFIQEKRSKSDFSENNLILTVSENTQANRVKSFDQWLLKQAKQLLTEPLMICAEEMTLARKIKAVKFRKTKTKWGHCTHDGVIQLSPLLLLAPEFVLHYLMVHELCHLVHQNHSKSYWTLVASHYPNYKEAELWLKKNGHRLWYR